MSNPIITCSQVQKCFQMGESTVHVLKGVDLTVNQGEFLAIEGRSGSGKSTLLHIMGALDEPSSGDVVYENQSLFKSSAGVRSMLRNQSFGFVFQFYHLLPELNVMENTMLAAMVKHSWMGFKSNGSSLQDRAAKILESLQMSHRLKHRPSMLSGGERQRVAIARALMNEPKVLFADEPTGNLDTTTGGQIMRVLEDLHTNGQTIVMVTHDRTIAKRADHALVLVDGKLQKA